MPERFEQEPPIAPTPDSRPLGGQTMTAGRLFAIGSIFVVTAIAWALLGANVVSRTGESDSVLRR